MTLREHDWEPGAVSSPLSVWLYQSTLLRMWAGYLSRLALLDSWPYGSLVPLEADHRKHRWEDGRVRQRREETSWSCGMDRSPCPSERLWGPQCVPCGSVAWRDREDGVFINLPLPSSEHSEPRALLVGTSGLPASCWVSSWGFRPNRATQRLEVGVWILPWHLWWMSCRQDVGWSPTN